MHQVYSHHLPLVLINKSAKPRRFKHMDMNSLPVHYYSQKKSWMDCRIFSEWFHQRFVPSVRIFCRKHKFETKARFCCLTMLHPIHHQEHCSQMMVRLPCFYQLTPLLPSNLWIRLSLTHASAGTRESWWHISS